MAKRIVDEREKMPLYSNIIVIKELLYKLNVRPAHFIIPLFLGLLVAVFEGISAGLLVPLARGVIKMDFGFVRELPIFRNVVLRFVQLPLSSNLFIFIMLVGVIFLAAIIRHIMQYLSSLSVCYQMTQFSNRLRKAIFSRYLSFGKLFFDRTNIGHLDYVLVQCAHIIIRHCMVLHDVFSNTFMFLVYIIIMFAISWKLTVFVIIVFPILNYSLKWLIKKIGKTSESYTKAHMALSRKIFNTLSCIPLVKAYTRDEEERREFDKASDLAAEWDFSMEKKLQLIRPVQEIILLIAILSLISFMAFMVLKGQSDKIGSFLVYFYILRRASGGFQIPNQTRVLVATISGPASELLKVFDDKRKFFVPEGDKAFGGLRRKIELNHLNFSYMEGLPILEDLSLSIEKGKLTAIVGPTGVGKTTLISLIMRFYDCPPSTIFIDGVDIREFTLKSLIRQMALVSQDILLFNDTLWNNITYGIDGPISEDKLIDVVKKARLYDFIMKLPKGLDTEIGDRGVKLSGGEKQRTSIARALLKNSEILILDEATSSLDTKTERLIQEAIEEAVRGRTTMVIAHRLSTIRNADKIVVIENGRLIEEGALNELLEKKGKFYQYWEEQKFY